MVLTKSAGNNTRKKSTGSRFSIERSFDHPIRNWTRDPVQEFRLTTPVAVHVTPCTTTSAEFTGSMGAVLSSSISLSDSDSGSESVLSASLDSQRSGVSTYGVNRRVLQSVVRAGNSNFTDHRRLLPDPTIPTIMPTTLQLRMRHRPALTPDLASRSLSC